jgi:uncharacterized phage protein (TIGR02218 family)
MRPISGSVAAEGASGVTTFCWCWRITRRDGRVLGFTDHDATLTFEGTSFEAASGMTTSEMRSNVGLSVDNLQVESALASAALDEGELDAGDYDSARIEIFKVDWRATGRRVLERVGTIGDVKRIGGLFSAEVRGLAHFLQQPRGRHYQPTCDAIFGDSRCGVDLSATNLMWSTTITQVESEVRITLAGSPPTPLSLRFGSFSTESGGRAGWESEIKQHDIMGGTSVVTLWQTPPRPLVSGQDVRVTVGCDKRLRTCAATFSNAVNFRGFAHMPGNDFLTGISSPGTAIRTGQGR